MNIRDVWKACADARRLKNDERMLRGMSDRELADIGLSRVDIGRAVYGGKRGLR